MLTQSQFTTTTPFSLPTPSELMRLVDTVESQRRIFQILSNYLSSIQQSDFLDRLNHKLHKKLTRRGHRSRRSRHNAAAADLLAYYATRPELKRLTLDVEMDRMEYTLILQDGQVVKDKDCIRAYFVAQEESRTQDQDYIETDELLVRAANQSILADAIVALTGSEDVHDHNNSRCKDFFNSRCCQEKSRKKVDNTCFILSGPTLSMSAIAEKCDIVIDLQKGLVDAVCVLATSVPARTPTGRLVLARAILSVQFQPGISVRYSVSHVKTYHSPDSTEVRNVATSLARDQNMFV